MLNQLYSECAVQELSNCRILFLNITKELDYSMKYLAIDVETANPDYSSICQIGIAEFENGVVIDKWTKLINPESYFDPFNISVHGIEESDVKDAPTFDQIYHEINERLHGRIAVHHMSFDKVALSRVCDEYQLPEIQARWLDSALVVRRTWEKFSKKGYGLENIAQYLEIDFQHHDALEDAIAAGIIVSHACSIKNITIEDWLDRVTKPINYDPNNANSYRSVQSEGNPEGALFGENLVFTGKLSLSRKEAAAIASKIGCNVSDSVTKKTTILVVGMQDLTSLRGYDKSSKHRRAEELISKGNSIKILSERDFIRLCNSNDDSLNLSIPDTKLSNIKTLKRSVKSDIALDEEESSGKVVSIDDYFVEPISNDPKALEELNNRLEVWKNFPAYSHEEKRAIAKIFGIQIDKLGAFYDENELESLEEDDDVDLIWIIEDELSDLNIARYDLAKNKTEVREFYFDLKNSIELIREDLEEFEYPEKLQEYARLVIEILTTIMEEILTDHE